MKKLKKAIAPKNLNPDLIFKCYKCSHNLYIDKSRVKKILKTDCPECGEEPYENWILIGEGNYNKEYK